MSSKEERNFHFPNDKSEELKEEVHKREGKVISLFAFKRGILVYIHA